MKKVYLIKSFFGKALGLMFKEKVDYGIVFMFYMENNTHHLHTCFMRFAVDILFLDSKFKVLKIIRNIKPWKLDIKGKGKYIVELPAGKSLNTKVGDKISFK